MATVSLEREVKLTSRREIPLEELGGTPLETRFFTSTYHDTPDFLLARCGITLRRRLEHGKNTWQLKLPVEAGRTEVEALGPPSGPPAELRDLLVAVTQRHELVPVATLQTRRSGVQFESRGGRAEIVFDAVAVMDGRRMASSFTEIEVELIDGDAKVLADGEKRLRRLGAKPGDGRNKLARALGLAGRTTGSAESDEERLRSFVAEQYEAILAADPAVRLGDDPEAVHRFRVAVRRLRAALRTAGASLASEWADPLRDELAWIGGVLGPLRDDDVLLERLREDASSLGESDAEALGRVIALVEAGRDVARAEVLVALADDRYFALLDSLSTASAQLLLVGDELDIDALAAKDVRRLVKSLDTLGDDPSDDELHAARIRGKRARYATELATAASTKRARNLLDALKELQDVLGDHNDGVVGEERLRELAGKARAPRAAFAAGLLAQKRRELADGARSRLPVARKNVMRAGRKLWS
jgi:CHAD domain-containing protein